MEIRAQAFAFSSNDELNNMTFYNYQLINRSTYSLNNAFFGVWVDADLGDPTDDLVGCDINRGLSFAYNGGLMVTEVVIPMERTLRQLDLTFLKDHTRIQTIWMTFQTGPVLEK